MGDRALIQLYSGKEVSPVLYLHWDGFRVGDILKETEERMKSRRGDVSYAFARLVQAAIKDGEGNTSYGVFNKTELLTEEDSHGDAGCFIVDVKQTDWKITSFGGYGLHGFGEDDAS